MCQRSLPSYRDILCVYVHMCMLVHGEAVHLAYQVFVDTFHRHIHGWLVFIQGDEVWLLLLLSKADCLIGWESIELELELATTSSSTHFHRQVHG